MPEGLAEAALVSPDVGMEKARLELGLVGTVVGWELSLREGRSGGGSRIGSEDWTSQVGRDTSKSGDGVRGHDE